MQVARRDVVLIALATLGAVPLALLTVSLMMPDACACPPFTGPHVALGDARVEEGRLRFAVASAAPGLAVRDVAIEVDGHRYAYVTDLPSVGRWTLWPMGDEGVRDQGDPFRAGDSGEIALVDAPAPATLRVLFTGGAWHGVELDEYVVLTLTVE